MDTSKFRTRQEFRTLINPKGKDFIIGLDAGYSGTKTFFESGCGTFPTYARKIDEMLYLTDENDIVSNSFSVFRESSAFKSSFFFRPFLNG